MNSKQTEYVKGMIAGAKMGAGQLAVAIYMLESKFKGTSTKIAEKMNVPAQSIVSRVCVLHEKGFLHICDWSPSRGGPMPMYQWNPGAADVPKPETKRDRLVAENTARLEEKIDPVRATKHGTEEVKGAVRTHKMRG